MKINLYYLIRRYRGGNDSVGRDSDAACIAGPFYCWNDAYEAKRDMREFADQYEIAKHALDVTVE